MQLQPGTYLQGDKYRIERSLGHGGFGITYLAEHEFAQRYVCIKEFFPKDFYNRNEDSRSISLGSKGSAETMERYKDKFVKEARTIARLDHPNIIHIHDVFTENNTAYYVMEYIDGESLNDVVKRRGALREPEAIMYIRAAAEAIAYIHERSIMHLDIKPANIMLRKKDNRAILIDFGLAKQYDTAGNQTSSTPAGISAGYAPIEQYKEGGVSSFSPETDIYSLGATLYYLVTGLVPPQAADIADEGLPKLPTHLSSAVRNTIERSMISQRKQRPHSIKEFLSLLDNNSRGVVPIPTPIQVVVDENTTFGVSGNLIDVNTSLDVQGAANPLEGHNSIKNNVTPGNKTPQAPIKPSTPKVANTPQPKRNNTQKGEKKSRKWVWILLLIAAAAYAILGNNSSSDSSNNSEKATSSSTSSFSSSPEASPEVESNSKNDNYSGDEKVESNSENDNYNGDEKVDGINEAPQPVKESPKPKLSLKSDKQQSIDCKGGRITIKYSITNKKSELHIDESINSNGASWIKRDVMSDNAIVYNISKYDGDNRREATITLTYGDQSITTKIIQQGKPKLLLLSKESEQISNKGGIVNIEYMLTNKLEGKNLSVATSKSVDWLKTSVSNDIIKCTIEKNSLTEPRDVTLTVTYADCEPFSVKITQEAKTLEGYANGYKWVDLGLESGTLWATCNIGASTSEQGGDLFAWGETKTKQEFTDDNYEFEAKNVPPRSNIAGNPQFDAATKNWGDQWCMPTEKQFSELMNTQNCDWKWDENRGGYKIISKKNNKQIFLPAPYNNYGAYWTSNSHPDPNYESWAPYVILESWHRSWHSFERYTGKLIRPVIKNN